MATWRTSFPIRRVLDRRTVARVGSWDHFQSSKMDSALCSRPGLSQGCSDCVQPEKALKQRPAHPAPLLRVAAKITCEATGASGHHCPRSRRSLQWQRELKAIHALKSTASNTLASAYGTLKADQKPRSESGDSTLPTDRNCIPRGEASSRSQTSAAKARTPSLQHRDQPQQYRVEEDQHSGRTSQA